MLDLYKKVSFTFFFLFVYRLGIFVTLPGVDRSAASSFVAGQSAGFLGVFNMFSGGAFANLSIFSLGVMPYVTASIAFQLLTMVVKELGDLRREGEPGQRILNQYVRYASIVLAVFQGFSVSSGLEMLNASAYSLREVVAHPGWSFRLLTVLTLSSGSAFAMWIGEQITERGIGNGVSLLIFSGIVSEIPKHLIGLGSRLHSFSFFFFSFFLIAIVCCVVLCEKGQRRIPVFYARRVFLHRLVDLQKAHLPLRLNMAGTVPPIFASSFLMFPATLAGFHFPGMHAFNAFLMQENWVFHLLYAVLVFLFCYVYTSITFQPIDVADNLRNQQAFIPKVRQGKKTAEYVDYVLSRITFGGALYVSIVCIFPAIVSDFLHIPFRWGGTSVMIVVGVALDVFGQLESHLITNNYRVFASGSLHKTNILVREAV